MKWKRTRIIKVDSPPLNLPVFDVKNYGELQKINRTIMESENAFYAVDFQSNFVYRLRKKNFNPNIRQVESVAFQPDQNIVIIGVKELLELAADLNSEVLETSDSLIMLTSGIVFISKLG